MSEELRNEVTEEVKNDLVEVESNYDVVDSYEDSGSGIGRTVAVVTGVVGLAGGVGIALWKNKDKLFGTKEERLDKKIQKLEKKKAKLQEQTTKVDDDDVENIDSDEE